LKDNVKLELWKGKKTRCVLAGVLMICVTLYLPLKQWVAEFGSEKCYLSDCTTRIIFMWFEALLTPITNIVLLVVAQS